LADEKRPLQYELTYQDVIQILKFADESTFGKLEIELDGFKLSVESGGRTVVPAAPAAARPTPPERKPLPAATPAAPSAVEAEPVNGIAVRSVTGGIFYRAPAPGQPPFTEVGQSVKAGDTLGLIELMKLFTPVTAPSAGKVRAFRVKDEQTVTANQVLVVIEPASN
jgi:acetyl-CoA carboxylase biotin carboxyl carrier protein